MAKDEIGEVMKRVLVPLAVLPDAAAKDVPNNMVRASYVRKLVKYNLLPVFVAAQMTPEMIDICYQESAGVMFLGGFDLNPKCYNEEKHPKNDCFDAGRDEMELGLLKQILKDKKPYLGICRGSQALAVASGGSLYQHLPDLNLPESHAATTYQDLAEVKHTALVDNKSRAFQIIGKETIWVNTGHHQAVKTLGANFRVAATSPEGVVELFEHTDPSFFCFGIQSHPEALPDSDLEIFFKKFAEAVNKA